MTKYVDKMILLKYNELNKPDESITNTVRFKKGHNYVFCSFKSTFFLCLMDQFFTFVFKNNTHSFDGSNER